MACDSCGKEYPTLRGRTFNVPERPIKDTTGGYDPCKPAPSPKVSKVITPPCPIKELPTCDQCQVVTATALPECDLDELTQNPCTLIVADEFENATCYTARKAIMRALRDLDGDNRFEELEKHVSDFNQVIAELNTSPLYKIQIPRTAILSSCGNCEYFLPPYFKQMITLTNDFPPQQNCFKVKQFIHPPHEQFFGSHIPEHYTIFNDRIIIKDPKECGCTGNTKCAKALKAHYWSKLPRATSLDDCLAIPEEEQFIINLNLTVNIGTMLGLNNDKVQQCQAKINEIKSTSRSYNTRKFDSPRYLQSGITINSWLGQ